MDFGSRVELRDRSEERIDRFVKEAREVLCCSSR